uniref:Uncharacterized protein n=2 Tax=Pyramimonas obovata TaxID=1411642 RepID=A0A7S0N4B3_9CHLO|mmetsp:Transcript_17827/g.38898  ORF Transcript_17827/g.38898 Transcript_17827/m.38898 type:complete len:229 (+) Transcript_17827:603-1289(+)
MIMLIMILSLLRKTLLLACRYVDHIRANAERYLHEKLGIPVEQVGPVRKKALALANQTVRGLRMQGYEFDAQEFTAYMRAGEELFMKPDPEVQDFLASLSQPMWIFTNTGEAPAERALELLGIKQYFQGILGADFMGDICKPQHEAFNKVLHHIDAEAESSVMFEDSLKNLVACQELGMATVFVTSEDPEQGVREIGADAQDVNALAEAVVNKCSLSELKSELPALWL